MRAVRWLVVLVLVLAGVPATASAQAAAPPGAVYTPLATPTRILDTRTPVGGHHRKVVAGETVALAVPGLPAGATAVVVNLTGTGGSVPTFLSLFPDRFAGTSTLNLAAGQTAAAGAFVALGADGRIRILNRNGTIDVVVDLVGYFAPDGAGFTAAVTATRILDTRSPGRTALAPGQTTTLAVRGAAGVPADATAALLNVTGVAPTAATFLRVTPDGSADTSTVNLAAGVNRANVTVTRIGADGAVRIRNHSGTTHVLVDVLGWFSPAGTGRYVPLASPQRLLDTRSGAPVAAGATRRVDFTAAGVPVFENVAPLFTLTAVEPTAGTYLTAWRAGTPRPQVSTLSAAARAIVPNTSVFAGTVADVYNHVGSTHVVVDAAGYFYAPTRPDPTVPAAPAITRAHNDGTAVDVSWTAPDDGGLPITGYTVTLQPGDRSVAVPARQTTATVGGLTVGGRYTLTVTATNLAGAGPASAARRIGPPDWLTRVDTTASGQSDPDPRSWLVDVSADGRYVLLTAQTNSVLVPAPYRTAEAQGRYQVRKDRETGAVELTSVGADGVPVSSGWSALAPDNRTVVFLTTSGIHVRDLVAGTTRTIVTARGTGDHTLSGNGRWVHWTSQRTLYRYDLRENRAETLLSCPDPGTGCHLASAPEVSDDGATAVFEYRAAPDEQVGIALFDAVTRDVRMLTDDRGHAPVITGDGTTVYFQSAGQGTRRIERIGTAPGAGAVTVREWQTPYAVTVGPNALSADGGVLGFSRMSQQWLVDQPGYLLETATGRETMLPRLRDTSLLGRPVVSADGSTAVAMEDCAYQEECGPTGVYAVPVPDLLSASG